MTRLWRQEDIKILTDTLKEKGESITVIIGENGGGKSFLLNEVAQDTTQHGKKVLLVSGTHENKFSLRSKLADKTLVNYQTRRPLSVLKKVIRHSFADYAVFEHRFSHKTIAEKRFQIGTALEASGLAPRLGIKIELTNSAEKQLPQLIESIRRARSSDEFKLDHYSDDTAQEHRKDLTIEYYKRVITSEARDPRRGPFWLDFGSRFFDSDNSWEAFLFIEYEKQLKDLKILKKLDLWVTKGKNSFPFQMTSSGEMSRIALATYISSVAEWGMHVIIDEPETSLHPTWQKEFIGGLLAAIGYNECKITIATHSPLIAAGAKLAMNYTKIHSSKIFNCKGFRITQNKPESLSVDALLDTHFNVIAPESHHLSTLIVGLLRSVEHRNITLEQFEKELKILENKTFDGTKQNRAFEAAQEFAKKLSP